MKKHLLIAFFSILLCSSCGKSKPFQIYAPENLLFLIKEGGVKLEDSVLTRTKLFHIDRFGKREYGPTADNVEYADTSYLCGRGLTRKTFLLGILSASYILELSVDGGIHDWYLEYPSGDLDTLFLVTRKLDDGWVAAADPCRCYNPITDIQFNGKTAQVSPDLLSDDGKSIYEFEK